MATKTDLLRIEASLRAAGQLEREVLALPAFELFISPGALDHLSFAVPISPGPAEWTEQVMALKEAFAQRGKRPRLEFVQDLHPALAGALEVAGLTCEMRAPLMGLDVARLPQAGSLPAQTRVLALDAADEAFLRRYLLRQSIAYGSELEDEEALDWLPALRAGLQRGTVLGAALERKGKLLSGAVIQIGAGVGELAGVWTDPQQRKQGLAYALCRHLLGTYAAAGYTFCWLSAAEGAQRLYEKLGFITIGTQLNYGAAH